MSNKPEDSDEVLRALDQGLVRDIHVDKLELTKTAEQFVGFLDGAILPHGLLSEYAPIHPDKIDAKLYPELKRLCRDVGDGWLHLPEAVARGYMFYLAKTVAERRQLTKLTDDPACWSVEAFFSEDKNFDGSVFSDEAEGYHAAVAFDDILPANVSRLTMTKLAAFMDKRRDERKCLRDELQEFGRRLGECRSGEHYDVCMADMRIKLERAKEEFNKAMDWKAPVARSAVLVGIPVAATVFAALALSDPKNPFQWTTLAPSVAIGAMAAYVDYSRATQLPQPNAIGSYLVGIEHLCSWRQGSNRLADCFEEFMND